MQASKDSPLSIEIDGDLLTLNLAREECANALSPALVEALIAALEAADGVRLCVIKGAGKHFCAGFDLADIDALSDGDLLHRFLRIEHLLQQVHHAPFVTLALARGSCIGAGADLFAACTHRIAAPNVSVRMPGWNFELALGTRRLTRLIGTGGARHLLIDTKKVNAAEAFDLGLASAIVEETAWDEIVATLLEEARALPKRALRQMLALTLADTRADDIATIVRSAGEPGLKARILAYRDRAIAEKKRRKPAA